MPCTISSLIQTVIEVGYGGWPYPLKGDMHAYDISTSSTAALRSAVVIPGCKSSFTFASTVALIRPASRIILISAGFLTLIWRSQLIHTYFSAEPIFAPQDQQNLFLQRREQGFRYLLNFLCPIYLDQF